jgi:hypothetical protein
MEHRKPIGSVCYQKHASKAMANKGFLHAMKLANLTPFTRTSKQPVSQYL